MTQPLPGALAGIRVLEFAQAMAVPVAGVMLSDMGAEVIKIEPREGDAFRHTQLPIVARESKGYTVLNRGKRGICLDVTHPDAAEVIERLVYATDVALVSLKPTDLPRYGLTYERFKAINPRIIFLEHVPLGAKGPQGGDGGYDVVVQGISGTAAITARSGRDAPLNVRPAYMDVGTGFLSALGVVAALRHRDLTGEGQRVETSLLATGITLANQLVSWFGATDPPVDDAYFADIEAARAAEATFEQQRAIYEKHYLRGAYGNIYFRHYRTKDGFISIGCLSPTLNARFRTVTGLRDPRIDDPDFDLGTEEAYNRITRLIREAEDLLPTRTTQDWLDAFRAGGVPCGRFNFPPEVFRDPQVLANDFVAEVEHPLLGAYKTFAPPIRMEKTPTRIQGPSPLLDADTDAVLAEHGYSAGEIAALRAAGVVGKTED